MTAPSPALPRRLVLAYALPWFAVQLCFLPMNNFVAGHYAEGLGVSLAAISGIVLLSRLLIDPVTDPLIGVLSDRTPLRYRRKLWVGLGVPVLLAGAWAVLVPPEDAGARYLLVSLNAVFLGFTMIQVPYAAWGAELTGDYDQRSRLFAWREGVGVLGTLCAIATPFAASRLGYEGLAPAMLAVAIGIVCLLPVLMGVALGAVPEPPRQAAAPLSLRESLRAVAANREFLWLMGASVFAFIGSGPGGATGYLMMVHAFEAPGLYGDLILAEFVAMLIGVPVWAWAAGRIGKHRALALGFLVMTVFTAPVPLLIGQDPSWVVLLSGLRGVGFGAAFVLPLAMLADVIDLDAVRTGRMRSGLYMALGGVVIKIAFGFGSGIALFWPTLFGFDQTAENTPQAVFHVAVAYAWISCAFWIVSVPLLWRYPLTKDRQRAARDALSAVSAAA